MRAGRTGPKPLLKTLFHSDSPWRRKTTCTVFTLSFCAERGVVV